MARTHGKGSSFSIDDAGGTPRVISEAITSIDFPGTVDMAEVSGMGDAAKEYLPGLADGTITITGNWEDAATTGADTVLGALFDANGELTAGGSLDFMYGPEGAESTDIKYSGKCFMTGYSQSSPLGGAVTFTATFQVTGAVTRGTY